MLDEILIQVKRRESNTTAKKKIMKLVKLQNLVANVVKLGKDIVLQSLQILYMFALCAEIVTIFGSKLEMYI
jgi:hypothetical protein